MTQALRPYALAVALLASFASGCSHSTLRSNVGSACTTDAQCTAGPSTPVCVTQAEAAADGYSAPGGYCTATSCDFSDPARSCGFGAFCLVLPGSPVSGCYAACTSSSDCRTGYECAGNICRPMPTSSCSGTSCLDGGVDMRANGDLGLNEDMHVVLDEGFDACNADSCPPPQCTGCLANCAKMSCVDSCGNACTGCNLAECMMQNTQNTQSMQNTQSTQNIQGTQNIQNTQSTESVQNTQNTESIQQNIQSTESVQNTQNTQNTQSIQQNIQNTENTQNFQNTENTQNFQNTENTQSTQSFENSQDTEDTQSTESTESTECFDCSGKKKGQPKGPLHRQTWWKLWQ